MLPTTHTILLQATDLMAGLGHLYTLSLHVFTRTHTYITLQTHKSLSVCKNALPRRR